MVHGSIRGLSNRYKDGIECLEIRVTKKEAHPLPFRLGKRVPIRLKVGANFYNAGLRSTKNNEYVWICPDMRDDRGSKVRLVDALRRVRLGKNDKVRISIEGSVLDISHLRHF